MVLEELGSRTMSCIRYHSCWSLLYKFGMYGQFLMVFRVTVLGNKLCVCYHLYIRHTTESVLVLHIVSEITRYYFHIKMFYTYPIICGML